MHHRCNLNPDRNVSEAKPRFLFWALYGLSKLLGMKPHSQSSLAILDVTSPVKFVVKIRYCTRFQTSSGNLDSMNRPGYRAAWSAFLISFKPDLQIDNGFLTGQS